jgi:hypothetical protein
LHAFFAPYHHLAGHAYPAGYYVKMALGFVIVLAILAVLQIAPRRSRKLIIAVFTFIGGIYYFLEFFWPTYKHGPNAGTNYFTQFEDTIANVASVLGAFAIGLGIISLLQFHFRSISRRRTGWGNSIAFLIAFVAMTVFGLLNAYAGHLTIIPALSFMHGPATTHDVYNFLFNGGLNNLDAAMFATIAFYIASASYRAFRIRSLESGLLMGAALIVMLGAVTFGTALTNWISTPNSGSFAANFRVERISNWLLTIVNSAAQRGIMFGLTLGGLGISLRYWLSLERGAYFDKEL